MLKGTSSVARNHVGLECIQAKSTAGRRRSCQKGAFHFVFVDELVSLLEFSLTQDKVVLASGPPWCRCGAVPMVLVLEYKDGDYPQHCSPCFLVAKPGSSAKRLVVDYGELNKKTLNHSGSIPNMESTLENIASYRYKTKMDKRSGFWHVGLTSKRPGGLIVPCHKIRRTFKGTV